MVGIYRSHTLPVLKNEEGNLAVNDQDKAEMLAEMFVKLHSDNISEDIRSGRSHVNLGTQMCWRKGYLLLTL